MLPVGGCDHAVSATTCQRFGFDLCGFRGAALNQSRSASGVYTGNFGDAKEGTGYVLYYRHFVTVTKRTGQDVFWSTADTPRTLQNILVRACPDTRTLLRLSVAGSYKDVLMFGKVNVNGGLTGGCAHCVITTTFAKCGGRYSPSRVRWRR